MPATDGLGHDLLGAVAGDGFEQCYNAQATVAADSLLVVTADVVQAANDKREIEPALAALARLPEALGTPESLLADSGYFSQANVETCADADIAPLIAQAREHHHLSWRDRFAEAPPAPEDPTPLEAMRHRLGTPEGRRFRPPCRARRGRLHLDRDRPTQRRQSAGLAQGHPA